MAKQFGCAAVVPGCSFTVTAENEADLFQQVAKHASSAHGIKEISPDIMAKVKAAVKDVPSR
jgi:predicted small metal-binding protein